MVLNTTNLELASERKLRSVWNAIEKINSL